jgi:hypothetical protein
MKCALTKVLPFILTLFVGLALGNFFSGRLGWHQVKDRELETPRNTRQERTWLVIHHQPQPSFPEESAENGLEPCTSAILRVRFDASGKVSSVIPEDVSPQVEEEDACVVAAVSAARQIIFTPASENGKPVSVVATVSYGYSQMHFRGVDKKGRVFCVTSRHPISSPVEIVSVEGAKETEGWRVIYE